MPFLATLVSSFILKPRKVGELQGSRQLLNPPEGSQLPESRPELAPDFEVSEKDFTSSKATEDSTGVTYQLFQRSDFTNQLQHDQKDRFPHSEPYEAADILLEGLANRRTLLLSDCKDRKAFYDQWFAHNPKFGDLYYSAGLAQIYFNVIAPRTVGKSLLHIQDLVESWFDRNDDRRDDRFILRCTSDIHEIYYTSPGKPGKPPGTLITDLQSTLSQPHSDSPAHQCTTCTTSKQILTCLALVCAEPFGRSAGTLAKRLGKEQLGRDLTPDDDDMRNRMNWVFEQMRTLTNVDDALKHLRDVMDQTSIDSHHGISTKGRSDPVTSLKEKYRHYLDYQK